MTSSAGSVCVALETLLGDTVRSVSPVTTEMPSMPRTVVVSETQLCEMTSGGGQGSTPLVQEECSTLCCHCVDKPGTVMIKSCQANWLIFSIHIFIKKANC